MPPGSHQSGNGKDIGEGPNGCSEEGNGGAAEPPVGGEVVGVRAHVDTPFWFLVTGRGGGGEAAGGGATLGREGRRVFGGLFGIAAAAGRGDGVGRCGGHGCRFLLFIYY